MDWHEIDDYSIYASNSQSVPTLEQIQTKYPELQNLEKINKERRKSIYSCNDDYFMAIVQDDCIYISVTNLQHEQLINGEIVTAQGGLSGYFSDQVTIDACLLDDGSLDNTKYNQLCQIAPYRERGMKGYGDASYKPHIDCLEINHDKLFEIYGSNDFNAAIAKCNANNQFGIGGGNQGYNPYINEMIGNGCLVHNSEKSYSNYDIYSISNNQNSLVNNYLSSNEYETMMRNADIRTKDCIQHNTPHPSLDARMNGYPHNPHPIEAPTGHGIPLQHSQNNAVSATEGMNPTQVIESGPLPDSLSLITKEQINPSSLTPKNENVDFFNSSGAKNQIDGAVSSESLVQKMPLDKGKGIS